MNDCLKSKKSVIKSIFRCCNKGNFLICSCALEGSKPKA